MVSDEDRQLARELAEDRDQSPRHRPVAPVGVKKQVDARVVSRSFDRLQVLVDLRHDVHRHHGLETWPGGRYVRDQDPSIADGPQPLDQSRAIASFAFFADHEHLRPRCKGALWWQNCASAVGPPSSMSSQRRPC